tara:strand:- start:1068 stop:1289 length:222 start_codon:yes stop_codon:yes gene_type:complete
LRINFENCLYNKKTILSYGMKNILFILFGFTLVFSDYEYSMQDYNSTSPTFGLDVWNPEYSNYMTLHFFSSQG